MFHLQYILMALKEAGVELPLPEESIKNNFWIPILEYDFKE
jgi:hypothetical protein